MCMVNAKRMVVLAAAAAAACLAANGMVRAASQSIVVANPSFEDNSITTGVGYGAINDWTSSSLSNTGLNTVGGPFATGTTIPDGGQVAFIQANSATAESLSQTLSGLIPGEQYWFQLFYNARQNYQEPTLSVTYGTQSLANITNIPVTNPNYTFLNVPFTPTASSGALTIANDNTTPSTDSTLLLDAVSVIERGAGQVVIANPSFQGSSPDLQLFNGIDGYSPAIAGWNISTYNNDVFTGINKSSGPFYNNGVAPDGTKVAYLQVTNGATAPTTISQTLGGLIAGDTYKLTFYYNARSGTADPLMEVSLGGTTFTPTGGLDVAPVGGSNPFYEGQYFYTATGPTAVLSFGNINTAATDSSLLLNDVSLQVVPEPAALGLMGAMGVGLLVVGRKRKRA